MFVCCWWNERLYPAQSLGRCLPSKQTASRATIQPYSVRRIRYGHQKRGIVPISLNLQPQQFHRTQTNPSHTSLGPSAINPRVLHFLQKLTNIIVVLSAISPGRSIDTPRVVSCSSYRLQRMVGGRRRLDNKLLELHTVHTHVINMKKRENSWKWMAANFINF